MSCPVTERERGKGEGMRGGKGGEGSVKTGQGMEWDSKGEKREERDIGKGWDRGEIWNEESQQGKNKVIKGNMIKRRHNT